MAIKGSYTDLTGQKFNKLTVIKYLENINGNSFFLCRCECDKEIKVRSASLKNGHTTSCGCANKISMIGKKFK